MSKPEIEVKILITPREDDQDFDWKLSKKVTGTDDPRILMFARFISTMIDDQGRFLVNTSNNFANLYMELLKKSFLLGKDFHDETDFLKKKLH